LILVKKRHLSPEDEKKITWPLYDFEFESGEVLGTILVRSDENLA
jgi:hypothetical protein